MYVPIIASKSHPADVSPDTFEALQILKSAYCNGHLSATAEADKYYRTIMNTLGGEEGASEGTVLEIL